MKKNLSDLTTIQSVYKKLYDNRLPKGYVLIGGNSECGYLFDSKETLIELWRDVLYFARFEDMYLYLDGKLIRTVRNYQATILGKMLYNSFQRKLVLTKTEYIKESLES